MKEPVDNGFSCYDSVEQFQRKTGYVGEITVCRIPPEITDFRPRKWGGYKGDVEWDNYHGEYIFQETAIRDLYFIAWGPDREIRDSRKFTGELVATYAFVQPPRLGAPAETVIQLQDDNYNDCRNV